MCWARSNATQRSHIEKKMTAGMHLSADIHVVIDEQKMWMCSKENQYIINTELSKAETNLGAESRADVEDGAVINCSWSTH